MLRYFDGRIAAELRLWDAIDQQYLAPFAYFGVHDGLDLRDVPWRRGQGYDVDALENVFTADHAWARLVVEEVRRKVADPSSDAGARLLRQRRPRAVHGRAVHRARARRPSRSRRDSRRDERSAALRDLADGDVRVVFTVDLFNEGIDVPTSTRSCCSGRPRARRCSSSSSVAACARRAGKSVCTVLDFVGTHRKEFRFDRRLRALLGGSRADVERQVRDDFPFLPAGCSFQLDPVAREIVLGSIRDAIPSTWRERCDGAALARRRGARRRTSRAAASSSRTSTPATTAGRRCVARPGFRPRRQGPRKQRCSARSGGCCTSTTTSGSTSTRGCSGVDAPPSLDAADARASSGSSGCSSRR